MIAVLSMVLGGAGVIVNGLAIVSTAMMYPLVVPPAPPPPPPASNTPPSAGGTGTAPASTAPFDGDIVGIDGLNASDRRLVLDALDLRWPGGPMTAFRRSTLDWFLADAGRAVLGGADAAGAGLAASRVVDAAVGQVGRLPGGAGGSHWFRTARGTVVVDDNTVRLIPAPGAPPSTTRPTTPPAPGDLGGPPDGGRVDDDTRRPAYPYVLDGYYYAGPDGRWRWASAPMATALLRARDQLGGVPNAAQAAAAAAELRAVAVPPVPYGSTTAREERTAPPRFTFCRPRGDAVEFTYFNCGRINTSGTGRPFLVLTDGKIVRNPNYTSLDPATGRAPPAPAAAPRLPAGRPYLPLPKGLIDLAVGDAVGGVAVAGLLAVAGWATLADAGRSRRLHIVYVVSKWVLTAFTLFVSLRMCDVLEQVDGQPPPLLTTAIQLDPESMLMATVVGVALQLVYPLVLVGVFRRIDVRDYFGGGRRGHASRRGAALARTLAAAALAAAFFAGTAAAGPTDPPASAPAAVRPATRPAPDPRDDQLVRAAKAGNFDAFSRALSLDLMGRPDAVRSLFRLLLNDDPAVRLALVRREPDYHTWAGMDDEARALVPAVKATLISDLLADRIPDAWGSAAVRLLARLGMNDDDLGRLAPLLYGGAATTRHAIVEAFSGPGRWDRATVAAFAGLEADSDRNVREIVGLHLRRATLEVPGAADGLVDALVEAAAVGGPPLAALEDSLANGRLSLSGPAVRALWSAAKDPTRPAAVRAAAVRLSGNSTTDAWQVLADLAAAGPDSVLRDAALAALSVPPPTRPRQGRVDLTGISDRDQEARVRQAVAPFTKPAWMTMADEADARAAVVAAAPLPPPPMDPKRVVYRSTGGWPFWLLVATALGAVCLVRLLRNE